MRYRDCALKYGLGSRNLEDCGFDIESHELRSGVAKQHVREEGCYLVKLRHKDSEDYDIENRYATINDHKHTLFVPFEEDGEWYEEVILSDDIILCVFDGVFHVEETHGRYISYTIDEVLRVMRTALSTSISLNDLEVVSLEEMYKSLQ